INTGIYCFKKECARQAIMKTNYLDFGKEIFPFLLENTFQLYGFVEKYYWMDIGNPTTYLWANWDILREYGWPVLPEGSETKNKIWWKKEPIAPPTLQIDERVCLGENIYFGENVKIGTLTSIGDNVEIGSGTIIEKSVIWDNVKIGNNVKISNAVIANDCIIGNDVIIRSESILGPNVTIEEGVSLGSITIKANGNISHK
ncbi:MAG: NDP-sugar synthase, partial [archaeon]|nr:NDP-sugar synthase [archaeon]